MKFIKIYIVVFVFAMGVASCELGDFGDTNVNPNATTSPNAANLLTNAITSMPGVITATQGSLYVQYLSNSQYTSADNYQTVEYSYNGYYTGPLYDLKNVIDINTDEETKVLASINGSNANQIAVSKILQAFYYHHVTDRWGDIPFSEALKVEEEILTPAFDMQSAVYDGIFSLLDEALGMMDGGNGPTGDALFGGDMAMWKKFANTLKMVAALRLSKADPTKGSALFNAAMNSGVIALDNSENVVFTQLAEENYDNVWEDRFETRRDYAVANTLVDYMQSTANGGVMDVIMDPRLTVYADPTENGGEYVGMTYGLSEADAGAISNSDVSFLGTSLRQQASPTYIYTSSQVLFSMAEAAELNWFAGDVEQLYYDAIEASMDQYGVADEFDTFITNSEVAFNASRALEQIGYQKWVSLYLNGYEAWAEWRRTGFPALEPASNALNTSKEIPIRQAYPTSERDLNETNYNIVVERQGEDGLDTPVWWDKN